MPLIMDDMDVDIDDLFGDGADLSLPSQPPPKELFQRIDELRGSGACKGLAWSKWGCIASISPDGAALELRNLRCHPRDGTWDLNESTTMAPITPTLDGGPLKHLCWSPNGGDLAAIDACGRISILTIITALNKPVVARSGQMDPAEDLHAVSGAYWLNLLPVHQRPPVIHSVAVKTEHNYRFDTSQAISHGPCHPNPQKAALVSLSINGVLRLLWPQNDGKWYETTSEIESVVSSDDLITHASFCADKNNTLLVAYATTTKQLRIVRMAIKWGNKPSEKPINSNQTAVSPSIQIRHVATTNWMDSGSGDGVHVHPLHLSSSMTALSHLEIFPPSPDGPGGQSTLPTVVTIRSHLPAFPSHFNQDTHSIVDRWELRESSETIHPAFEELSSRRNSVGSQPGSTTTLRNLDGFTANKVVVSIYSVALDRILVFAYSDGSVEYRDRSTMSELFTEGSLERFTHLSQLGFSYSDDEPCLQVAPSPTNCSVVQISSDGKHKWKVFTYHMEDNIPSPDDPHYGAVVAALTMSCGTAVMASVNYDDVLAFAGRYSTVPNLGYKWLNEVSRLLKFHVDYSEETHHDTLIRNPSVQLCLSIQNSLGYRGDASPREFGSKLAWITLQCRNCVVLMTMAANMKVPDPEHQTNISGHEDPDAIRIISGSVRWCLDLIAWLVDSLLHPEDSTIFKSIRAGQDFDLHDLNMRLKFSNNVALHLLLSSATRGYLTAICRRLSQLDHVARKAMLTAAQNQAVPPGQSTQGFISNSLRASYQTIATLTQTSIINIRNFEIFLTSISASVKESYAAAGLARSPVQTQPHQAPMKGTDVTRNSIELDMLLGDHLPKALSPAMSNIFTILLPALRASIDPSKLFFHDFSLLALEPSSSDEINIGEKSKSAGENEGHTIDIFRHVPIVLGRGTGPVHFPAGQRTKRWRRCVRCAAVMEDITSAKPAVQFLIMQQRKCFCGGNWDVFTGPQVTV